MTPPIRALVAIAALALVAADRPAGYLPPGAVDLTTILPPAPIKGDIRYETDRRVFKAMKAGVGGVRWRLATSDAAYATPAMLADFSCAAGLALSPQGLPATTRLLDTASADTGRANNAAKEHWRRLRPYRIDKGEICQPASELGESYDYPSGHTTKGWTFGLILAELLPDRATPILTRARAYGESRIVCRVHNYSAVEAGMLGATVSMEAVRATPAYQADFAAAKAEIAGAGANGTAPDAATCARNAAVSDPSVMAGLRR